MPTQKEILNYLKENKKRFHDKFHISQLGLFGSYARDEADENSDIDLIIEFDENVDLFQIKEKLRTEISLKFKKKVDICRPKYIKKIVKDKILSETIYV